MLRCNGLEILNPKHMWKSENGPLQPILATKRYVAFFLGHPVVVGYMYNTLYFIVSRLTVC